MCHLIGRSVNVSSNDFSCHFIKLDHGNKILIRGYSKKESELIQKKIINHTRKENSHIILPDQLYADV